MKVVAAVLVDDNKNIVLVRRQSTSKHYPNCYEFPGGKIQTNESAEDAIIRELKEELNIHVVKKNIKSFPNNVKCFKNNLELNLFIIYEWKGSITIDLKIHDKIKRVSPKKLKFINELIENDKSFINDMINYIQIQ